MASRVAQFPIRTVGNEDWIALCYLADAHQLVAYKCKIGNEEQSFAGGHRVRLINLKGNVHLKVPVTADIRDVPPAVQPARRQPR